MRNNLTRRLCTGGVIAALYAVLTLALPMLSYGPVQIRFAEALTVLPFFLPEAVPGLAVGCFVANLIGSPYALDWVVGTLATLLAALWTSKLKHKWLAPLPPVICNMVIVGAEIAWFEGGFGTGRAGLAGHPETHCDHRRTGHIWLQGQYPEHRQPGSGSGHRPL